MKAGLEQDLGSFGQAGWCCFRSFCCCLGGGGKLGVEVSGLGFMGFRVSGLGFCVFN